MMVGMNIIMTIKQIRTLEQVGDFLLSVGSAELALVSKDEAYRWVAQVLKHFAYQRLGRPDKSLIQRFLMRVTGYSRQQLTRLIKRFHCPDRLQRRPRTVNGFKGVLTAEVIALLAFIDGMHESRAVDRRTTMHWWKGRTGR